MSLGERLNKRVVAICPTSRGFGFVVFEDPKTLLDWGVAQIPPAEGAKILDRISGIIDQNGADILVIESTSDPRCRRRDRVRSLLRAVRSLAARKKVPLAQVTKGGVRRAFARQGASTKQQIASVIASQLPELRHRLPPPRDIWESEAPRLSLFGAASFALTFYLGADP